LSAQFMRWLQCVRIVDAKLLDMVLKAHLIFFVA
jgi:hypothetical protein